MKHTNFTLLELLVVIAVVAIISALSSAILNTVRESAKKAVCYAQLKEIGVLTQIYQTEYDEYTLPADLGGLHKNWINYLSVKTNQQKIFKCPSMLDEECFNPYGYGSSIKFGSYVMNTIQATGWSGCSNPPGEGKIVTGWGYNVVTPIKISQVKNPSMKYYIMDFIKSSPENNSSTDARGIISFAETDHGEIGYGEDKRDCGMHHSGGFNSVFGDTHVETIIKSQESGWKVVK